ncbi:hypothetical protein ACROYT_G021757 [Oculina patagonica]
MLKCRCVECGIIKTKFVKSQSGGALARYKPPSTVDKIAYVASNFVTPSPSFASMARLLAGQALKGVKDNVDYYRKGKGIDIHKAILKVAPKKGFVMPGHRYTGPGNPLEKQVKWDQKTGKILEIYEKPTGKTDAVSMQHDVDYSVCANKSSKDQVKCKNEADRKMVKSLDAIPWKDRQWGHALARNIIADNKSPPFASHTPEGIKEQGPEHSWSMYVYERFNTWIDLPKNNESTSSRSYTVKETYRIFDWVKYMCLSGQISDDKEQQYALIDEEVNEPEKHVDIFSLQLSSEPLKIALKLAGLRCTSIERSSLRDKSEMIYWQIRSLEDRASRDRPRVHVVVSGFYSNGEIKSDWRSYLSVEVLDCLTTIRIEWPSVAEFDPQPGLQFCGLVDGG